MLEQNLCYREVQYSEHLTRHQLEMHTVEEQLQYLKIHGRQSRGIGGRDPQILGWGVVGS